jgi:hypothetical protein
LRTELVRVDDLAASQGEVMITLFQRFFEDVSREQFHKDLDEKGWAILIEDDLGELRGFTTLDLYEVEHDGRTVSVVHSGDTIVDDAARGSTALSSTWIGAVNHLRRELDKDRLWWLLMVSGYRTYRFLPVFWKKFWPSCEAATPRDVQSLIDALAEERRGERYDRKTGIVRRRDPHVLRQELRGVPARRMRDPHVAFFAKKNPGHEKGDELVCLTELAHHNLTDAGRRMWHAGERMFAPQVART